MLFINGRSSFASRCASSCSICIASSREASSCRRIREVSSVRNRMRPVNLMVCDRFVTAELCIELALELFRNVELDESIISRKGEEVARLGDRKAREDYGAGVVSM